MLLSQIRYEQHHLQVLLRQDIPKEVSFESLNRRSSSEKALDFRYENLIRRNSNSALSCCTSVIIFEGTISLGNELLSNIYILPWGEEQQQARIEVCSRQFFKLQPYEVLLMEVY